MGAPTVFDLELGEFEKTRGQQQAADRQPAWRDRALALIYDYAQTGETFTADDVIAVLGLPGVGVNRNNSVGAIFTAARKRGWIVPTGSYRKSRRTLAHARAIAVWVGNPAFDFYPTP